MNLKSFEKKKATKNKIENIFTKSLVFATKPLCKTIIKTIDWYKETQFYENNEIKKYTKKIYSSIYRDVSYCGYVYLTDKHVYEYDSRGDIISFNDSCQFYDVRRLVELRGISPSELLEEIIDTLSCDSNVDISKESTKNIFKWKSGNYGEYFYKVTKV